MISIWSYFPKYNICWNNNWCSCCKGTNVSNRLLCRYSVKINNDSISFVLYSKNYSLNLSSTMKTTSSFDWPKIKYFVITFFIVTKAKNWSYWILFCSCSSPKMVCLSSVKDLRLLLWNKNCASSNTLVLI